MPSAASRPSGACHRARREQRSRTSGSARRWAPRRSRQSLPPAAVRTCAAGRPSRPAPCTTIWSPLAAERRDALHAEQVAATRTASSRISCGSAISSLRLISRLKLLELLELAGEAVEPVGGAPLLVVEARLVQGEGGEPADRIRRADLLGTQVARERLSKTSTRPITRSRMRSGTLSWVRWP